MSRVLKKEKERGQGGMTGAVGSLGNKLTLLELLTDDRVLHVGEDHGRRLRVLQKMSTYLSEQCKERAGGEGRTVTVVK